MSAAQWRKAMNFRRRPHAGRARPRRRPARRRGRRRPPTPVGRRQSGRPGRAPSACAMSSCWPRCWSIPGSPRRSSPIRSAARRWSLGLIALSLTFLGRLRRHGLAGADDGGRHRRLHGRDLRVPAARRRSAWAGRGGWPCCWRSRSRHARRHVHRLALGAHRGHLHDHDHAGDRRGLLLPGPAELLDLQRLPGLPAGRAAGRARRRLARRRCRSTTSRCSGRSPATSSSSTCCARRSAWRCRASRDNARRMSALGFNLAAHRVAAYAVAGAHRRDRRRAAGLVQRPDLAGLGRHVGRLINILIIAVLGGMRHPIGPFIGAMVFVLLQNFAIDLIDRERFNLVIGLVFLVDRAVLARRPARLVGGCAIGRRGAWHSARVHDAAMSGVRKRFTSAAAGPPIAARRETMTQRTRMLVGLLAGAAVATVLSAARPGAGNRQDRPAGHARRAVRGRRPGRHARRRACGEGTQRHGRRQEDRDHQGLVRRQARRGGQRHPQAGRAGQGPDHGRPALGLRGHRGQELLQVPARHHLHQRLVGRAGHDAGQPVAQLLPLQHRRRAVDGRARRLRARRQGLQEDGR